MMAKKELVDDSELLPEEGNIDKIRDILFGVQVRDFERKFAELEEKFGKEVNDLRNETHQNLNKLEEFINKEVSSLTDKIHEEQDLRGDALKKLTSEMNNANHDLEGQIAKLGENIARNESSIRSQIHDQAISLSDTIQKKHDEVLSSLNKESSELRDDKTDRAALAELFSEMSMRLNGDSKLPDSKSD